jgi:hypothetical protein
LDINFIKELSEAWQYTKSLFSRINDLLVLLILMAIPGIDLLMVSYYTRVLRDPLSSSTPPKLDDPKELLLTTVKTFVAALIWILAATAVLVIAGVVFNADFFVVGDPAGFVQGLPGIIGMAIPIFIIALFGVISITHMFKQKSFNKAFAFGELWQKIMQIGPVKYIAFMLAWFITEGVLMLLLLAPIGSGLILMGVLFLALSMLPMMVFVRALSILYGETVSPAVAMDVPPPPPPA